MNYSNVTMTNIELAILEIIAEKRETSGYLVGKVIAERGYRNWADLGKTSIYMAIRKLKRKGLISIRQKKDKTGRGPRPNAMTLTTAGQKELDGMLEIALLSSRDLGLYYLGIAGSGLIEKSRFLGLLMKRKAMNSYSKEMLKRLREEKGGDTLPLEADALFIHPVKMIEADDIFLDEIISKMGGNRHGKD
jgi:DNA-binding PadR family transcriptional regulator